MKSRFAIPAAAALLLLAAAGCRAPAADAFGRVAERIETGGSRYEIITPRYVIAALESYGLGVRETIAQAAPEMSPELRDKSNAVLAYVNLAWQLLGVEELDGIGRSSKLYREYPNGRRIFNNREVAVFRPEGEGVLANYVRTVPNRDLSDELGAIPVGAAVAFDLSIDFRPLLEALRKTDRTVTELDALSQSSLKIPLEKLVEQLTGEYAFLLFLDEGASPATLAGVHALLALPDREKFLFDKLKTITSVLPGTRAENEEVKLGPLDAFPGVQIAFSWHEDVLILRVNEIDRHWLEAAPLAETDSFQQLTEGLPREGTGFCYLGPALEKSLLAFIGQLFGRELAVPPTFEGFYLFRHEKDASLSLSRTTWDLNQMDLVQNFFNNDVTQKFILEHLNPPTPEQTIEELMPEESAQPAPKPAPTAEELRFQKECAVHLGRIRDGLVKYADAHEGRFPADANLEGLRLLAAGGYIALPDLICPATEDTAAAKLEDLKTENCSYLYFEGADKDSNPKLPLAADWPDMHPGVINVLYVDGSVEAAPVDDIKNCKRFISYLQTLHRYSETDFRRLLRQAAAIDREFELEEK